MVRVLSTWRVRAVSSSERLFRRPLHSQKGSIPLWASVRDPPFRDLGERGEHESISPRLHRGQAGRIRKAPPRLSQF